MTDQSTFMDTLRSVAEIVRVSGEPVKREDIKTYFKDMKLTEQQEEMVYQYLLNPPVEEEVEQEPEETEEVSDDTDENEEQEDGVEQPLSESVFFQMYMEDLHELPKYNDEEKQALYERLLSGDSNVIPQLSDAWLLTVIEMAKAYTSRNVTMEDVIQEGNIGLLIGLNNLLDFAETSDVEAYLRDSIKESMESFIEEYLEENDLENTVLAKSNLVYEAKKVLAEQLGHVPTTDELCNFTNMPATEIDDIISLAEEKKKK